MRVRLAVIASLMAFTLSSLVEGTPRLSRMASGYDHACAIRDGGSLYCWGTNREGQLGLGNQQLQQTPEAVPIGAGEEVVHVAAGLRTTCALFASGALKCWGANSRGQLGLGMPDGKVGAKPDQTVADLPAVALGNGARAVKVAISGNHACAVLADGNIKCWGYNATGQLGHGDTVSRGRRAEDMGDELPRTDLGDRSAVDIAVGAQHSCALLDDDTVKCWGSAIGIGSGGPNALGVREDQMGNALKPVSLGNGFKPRRIASASSGTCALSTDGRVKCWGTNQNGALGIGKPLNFVLGTKPGEMGDALAFVSLAPGLAATDLACGGNHCCAILENAAIKCWGGNNTGQLGLGDRRARGITPDEMGNNLPYVELGRFAQVTELALGLFHSCAGLEDGKAKCWGNNQFGQLGYGLGRNSIGSLPGEMGDKLAPLVFETSDARREP